MLAMIKVAFSGVESQAKFGRPSALILLNERNFRDGLRTVFREAEDESEERCFELD